VIACCRNVDDCAAEWESYDGRVHVLRLDLADQSTIEAAGAALRER
jgi:hypothetical protein